MKVQAFNTENFEVLETGEIKSDNEKIKRIYRLGGASMYDKDAFVDFVVMEMNDGSRHQYNGADGERKIIEQFENILKHA